MRWNLKPKPDSEKIKSLQNSLNVDELTATLLVQRGIENFEEARQFFRPKLEDLHDPYLMKDMDKAVSRIEKAIEKQALSIEKNLYTDPDFRKSYEESRKAAALKGDPFIPMHQREIIPMIAYLQRMGTDIKVKESK
mgnify:CR=1 FL=1